jgi:hypothetical protein
MTTFSAGMCNDSPYFRDSLHPLSSNSLIYNILTPLLPDMAPKKKATEKKKNVQKPAPPKQSKKGQGTGANQGPRYDFKSLGGLSTDLDKFKMQIIGDVHYIPMSCFNPYPFLAQMRKEEHEKNCRVMRAARVGYESQKEIYDGLDAPAPVLTTLVEGVVHAYNGLVTSYNNVYTDHVDDFKSDAPTVTSTAVAISDLRSTIDLTYEAVLDNAEVLQKIKRRIERRFNGIESFCK